MTSLILIAREQFYYLENQQITLATVLQIIYKYLYNTLKLIIIIKSMKQESSKLLRKKGIKSLTPIYYGQNIYLKNLSQSKKSQSLWGRGFMDTNIYLSSKPEQIQSQFTIEPKKGLYSFEGKTTTPVVFGAEVLIKHVLSQQYVAIGEHDEMPTLQFQKQETSSCYFQFVPSRSFESNGNVITTDSVFVILNSERKLYITDLQNISSLPEEPNSPNNLTKKISKDQSLHPATMSEPRFHSGSGSAAYIPLQSDPINQKQQKNVSDFKKKSVVNKRPQVHNVTSLEEMRQRSSRTFSTGGFELDEKDVRSTQQLRLKRTASKEQETTEPLQKVGSRRAVTVRKQQSKDGEKDQIIDQLTLLYRQLNTLPIFNKQSGITNCSVENYSYSQWVIEHVRPELRTEYLNNSDLIYFTHSQANQIMTLDIEKNFPEVTYVKNTNQSENQYILNSIFVVEIELSGNHKYMYLKHFLTGRYFPISNHKVECELVALLSPKKNQYPPFKILFDGQIFQKSSVANEQNLHGFWLNKISKTEIAQIMSLQNCNADKNIQSLIKYLRNNTRRRQKLLRQFMYIPRLIYELSQMHTKPTKQNKLKPYYQLLFNICRNNEKNKKQCLKYIDKVLKHPEKELILDLLTELIVDNSNIYTVEKAITPAVIEDQLRQFIDVNGYSISFMRIFRVFCGSDEQPSLRNQSLLFSFFFWNNQTAGQMTQSAYQVHNKLELPSRYKFRMFEQEGSIYFANGTHQQKYQNLREDVIYYLRQYFYLLSDCMNGNNYPLIRNFTSIVTFEMLLKILKKEEMKGPVLSLLYNAYLKPQKKYKPHIFHKDYEKICEKGSLISYSNQQQQSLRDFVDKQIRENKNYSSTMYRILLNVLKMTIENGYWRKFDDLIDLMNCLDGVLAEPESDNSYHNTYEEKANDRNLLRSKITAVSIKIVLIEMQISLWASDHISGVYTENQIERRLADQIKHSKNWIIDENILRLCSTNSPQLLRKAILLLYKIYNLYKLAHKNYEEANIELKSRKQLVDFFAVLQMKEDIKADGYFIIIAACIKDPITRDQLNFREQQQNYSNLQSVLRYRQVNEQVQNMASKLGLHDMLIHDIKRYMSLGKRLKQDQQDIIYWKLLTLYAIIKNNLKLRDIIAQHRKLFIPLLESQWPLYYIATDIIEQIYRNNRKLIISDNDELKNVCKSIDVVFKSGKIDLRLCRVINLLSTFIETGNRKIVENHQIILQYVFTKHFVSTIIRMMKSNTVNSKDSASEIKEQYFRNVIQVVIYDLLVTMGQKKLLSYFERPSNATIYFLLLGIGINNWSLKSKTFLCINFTGIKEDHVNQIIRIILYDLNVMCESLKVCEEHRTDVISKQVKIYISNITKILDTIEHLFKACLKKLSKESEEEIFFIKIVERLFIMKSECPEIVHKKIDNLLQYIAVIENRLKRKGEYFDLTNSLKKIQIKDFEKNQIKDKLPLIYSEKIRNKSNIQRTSPLQQKNSFVEQVVKKKQKINIINKNTFEMTDDNIKQLRTLILNLSYVNKSDSSLLSDNIKQFLINFLRVSFLDKKEKLIQMQDILVTYEVPTIVCSILQEPFKHRYKLFSSTFELGIKLLEGGHTKCQQKFLEKFKEDGKNWIFQNIYQIIFDSLATIQFYYNYKQDPTIKSYEMILDLEEYYYCKQERKVSCQLLANAFRFLQQLCENDNHNMKDYMYNQLDKDDHIKYMTKNFIEVAQRILDGVFIVIEFNIRGLKQMPNDRFEEQVRNNIYNLPIFILDFLVEVCQIPADQNQLYLCRTDFLDFVKKLIDLRQNVKQSKQSSKDWSIFFVYEKKTIILLKSLLEQNSEQISTLLRKKIGNKQFKFFIEESFAHGGLEDTEKLKQMLTETQLNIYVQNIFHILIVKKILKIDEALVFEPQKLKIINQLSNRIQSIHVDFKTHSLAVYFPFHPLFALLSKKTKDFMLDRSANLSTRREKLTQLLISREVIYQDINQERNSEKRLLNQQKMGYMFNAALILCYLIIFLLVLFYSVGKSGAVLDIYEVQIISGLCYIELFVSAIYAVLLGFNTYPVAKQKIKTHEAIKRRSEPNYQMNVVQKYLRRLKVIYVDEPQSTHALILLIISFYSCFFQVRVYSFTLIFAFAKIELLESILKSIRLTWQQLAFVCLLALAFSFIFGFITLNYYIGPLYENQEIDIDIDRINEHCNSIITCVSSLYTQKIIGESVSRQDEQYNYGRFVSDLVYWGFFEILLSNIIAAIIIDKFAQQRNAKEKIEHQRYSKCYICFADKSTLERRGEDFMSHVNNVHNLWNYFFYMYTLENLKDLTDFTGIEYWINRQVKQNQIDWIPIDDSFKDEDVSLQDLIEKIRPMLAEKESEQK